MSDNSKFVQFVSKLVEMTQRGEISWGVANAPDTASSTSFEAIVNGQKLRIYRRRPERIEANINVFGLVAQGDVGQYVAMDVMDILDRPTFTFKGVTGLNDLYNAVSRSASKVDDLIDAVLAKNAGAF